MGDDEKGACFDDGDVESEDDHCQIPHDDRESNAAKLLEKLERENNAQLALVEHHENIASDVLKVSARALCFPSSSAAALFVSYQ